jgi:predicted nucleic acid-binding protein
MLELPIQICGNSEQFQRALDLAERTKRIKTYDMQYVAVAEIEDCEMIALDGGVYQAAIEIGLKARLLR